nr:hypothetical protein [Janibacter hoylei]
MGEAAFELPADLPLGWHVLLARPEVPLVEGTEQATLVTVPQRLELPRSCARRRAPA